MRIGLQRRQQLVEPVELGGEALFHRLHAKTHRQVRLADARRPLDQQRLVLPDPGTGRQGVDPRALDRRLEAEVEAAKSGMGSSL